MRKVALVGGRLLVTVLALALAWEAGAAIVDIIDRFPASSASPWRFPLEQVSDPEARALVGLAGEAAVAAVSLTAAVILWKLRDSRAVTALALFLLFAVACTSPTWFVAVLLEVPSRYSSFRANILYPLPGWLALAALLRFSALFPSPLAPDHLSLPDGPGPLDDVIVRLRRWLLHPPAPWGLAVTLWAIPFVTHLFMPGLDEALGSHTNNVYGLVGTLLFFGLGVLNLHTGYRRAGEAERRKILWLVAGLTASIAIALVPAAVDGLQRTASWLGVSLLSSRTEEFIVRLGLWGILYVLAAAVLVGSLLFSVFYRGALSPELVIRKSVLYGLLTTALVVVFSGGEAAASAVLQERLAAADTVATTASGVVVALLFKPVEGFLERKVEETLPDELTGERTGGEGTDSGGEGAVGRA